MNNSYITNKLARLLLVQSGILRADEVLTPDPQVPASVGDILCSKNYWLRDENEKNKRNKTS